MPLIGPLDSVRAGEYLRVWVDLAGIAPANANIASALSGEFNVVEVTRGLFSGQVQVTILVQRDAIAGEIGKSIADRIENGFIAIVDADPVRYETLFSPPSSGDKPGGGVPVTTTITVTAIALIALVGYGVLRKVT